MEIAANETINWLDTSQEATKEEYEEKKAELKTITEYVCFYSFYLIFCLSLSFSALTYMDSTLLQAVHPGGGSLVALVGFLMQAAARSFDV